MTASLEVTEAAPGPDRFKRLLNVLERLNAASSRDEIIEIVYAHARYLANADGISVVLRDGEQCHYVAEDAPAGPLWRGRRFQMMSCISGWVMLHRQTAIIEDVYKDERIPHEAYRPTFVRSLVMVPLGEREPLAALGIYWSRIGRPGDEEIVALETLARAAGAALDRQETADRLRESEARYRTLFNSIDQGFCVVEVLFDEQNRPLDYRFLETNAVFEAQTGLEDAVGKSMRALRPDHEEHWFQIYGNVALTGAPIRFERTAAALGREYDVYAFRVGEPEQRRVAILFNDITQRKRDEERLKLLATEVNHRAKNMLSLVSIMVRLTNAETVPAYRADLLGRINALLNSQRLLSETHWHGADLAKLVEGELAGYRASGDGRVSMTGPVVTLAPAAAQPMAMALHELATNATKYGALSVPDGRVTLEWAWREDGRLAMRWSESGGPPVEAPARQGIGTGVIMRCIRDQLGGEIRFTWHPEGLRCELVVKPDASKAPRQSRH